MVFAACSGDAAMVLAAAVFAVGSGVSTTGVGSIMAPTVGTCLCSTAGCEGEGVDVAWLLAFENDDTGGAKNMVCGVGAIVAGGVHTGDMASG